MKEEKTTVLDGSPVENPSPVDHPSHYNGREDGLECIDVIRHYTCDIANAIKYLWRAGLKQDADKSAREKEIEDLRKAIWYIRDHITHDAELNINMVGITGMEKFITCTIGVSVEEIIAPYTINIRLAMNNLLHVGFIHPTGGICSALYDGFLQTAIHYIQSRIDELQNK